jgi:hypothetical protein
LRSCRAFERAEGPIRRKEDPLGENIRVCEVVEVIGIGGGGRRSGPGFRLVRSVRSLG